MDFDFEARLILENERVRLEPLGQYHFSELLPIALAQPDLLQYSPSEFGSEAKLKTYLEQAMEQRKDKKRYAFAIFDKSAGKYAGSTSLGEVFNQHKRLQLGWTWIGREFQQSGLNRACKYLLLKFIFESLSFERIEFVTDARNLQSQKAIEAIGGKFEGELRSHVVMPNGFRRNTRIYSILKEEWKALKNSIFEKYEGEASEADI